MEKENGNINQESKELIEENEHQEKDEPIGNILGRIKNDLKTDEAEKIHFDSDKESVKENIQNKTDKTDRQKDLPRNANVESKKKEDQPQDKTKEVAGNDDLTQLKVDNERLTKALKDNQRWARGLSQKSKTLESQIKDYINSSVLTESEGKILLNSISNEEIPEQEESYVEACTRIWDSEIDNIRKYTNDSERPELDKHIWAFQFFMRDASEYEKRQIFDELEKIKLTDSVAHTRKMLSFGKEYYENIYKDIMDAGSLGQYKQNVSKELAKKDKTIDSLKAKIVKLEQKKDYIEPTSYSLPNGGESSSYEEQDASLKGIFARAKSGRL